MDQTCGCIKLQVSSSPAGAGKKRSQLLSSAHIGRVAAMDGDNLKARTRHTRGGHGWERPCGGQEHRTWIPRTSSSPGRHPAPITIGNHPSSAGYWMMVMLLIALPNPISV
jgi:hypothetical protein